MLTGAQQSFGSHVLVVAGMVLQILLLLTGYVRGLSAQDLGVGVIHGHISRCFSRPARYQTNIKRPRCCSVVADVLKSLCGFAFFGETYLC